jgi:8-oxo-dGTP pyrophosphatase MutT (NUDIX family)
MRLHQILPKIKQIRPDNLPGFEAQAKMSPPMRQQFTQADIMRLNAKKSAVLVLLYEKNQQTHIVFTQRQEYNGAHSGQISFPGGKMDNTDPDLTYTALRETAEEVGVDVARDAVIGELSYLYVPPSNFVIYPYIAHLEELPQFVPEEKEVKRIIELPVQQLLNPRNQQSYRYHNKRLNIEFDSPSYLVEGTTIWGATAMILSELLTILDA